MTRPRPVFPPILAVTALLASLAVVPPSPAAPAPQEEPEQDITVILRPGERPLLRLAFPAIERQGPFSGPVADAARELDETLRFDLEDARIFRVQGPNALAIVEPTGDRARDFEHYRALGNEVLLQAELRQTDEERLVLEARVFDLASGEAILPPKRYTGHHTLARRIAHTYADEVVLYFTGRRGVAQTTIAFTSDRDGFKEVYLMDYDGHDQRRITAHHSLSLFPAWSPTGDALSYVSYQGGSPAIYALDLSAGRQAPVVTDGTLNTSPTFSPDGRRIAFARAVGGSVEIFVTGRDGGNHQRLTHTSALNTTPAWSPSGREIAFTSNRAGSPQIYVMSAEGTNVRRVTFDGPYSDGAAWSPDGTRLAYATRIGAQFEIAVVDLVTLERRILTSGPGSKESPTFSPDGRRIAFSWRRAGGTQIYTMDADGRNARRLTEQGNNTSPSWSGYPR